MRIQLQWVAETDFTLYYVLHHKKQYHQCFKDTILELETLNKVMKSAGERVRRYSAINMAFS